MQVDMGRRRSAKNRDLEPGVKRDSRGYISYKHKLMDKPHFFGKDVSAANKTARLVNAELSGVDHHVKAILNTDYPLTFSQVLDKFVKERIPELEWAKSYATQQKNRIAALKVEYGHLNYNSITIKQYNDILDTLFSGDGKRVAIYLLQAIDHFGRGRGLREINVASDIIIPKKSKRKRNRIKDLDQFHAIIAECPEWLKRACWIALITLQPREVICSWELPKASAEWIDSHRGKTGANIRIRVGASLRGLIQECRIEAVGLGTRRLICRSPDRGSSVTITPDYLTRAFNKAVAQVEQASEWWGDNPPTFHEIRSLGARLYKQQGYTHEEIQALLGHEKADTTKIYLDSGEPEFIQARAGMEL